ncbi:MAG: hypothetical protein E7654_09025 [Ruminococcaceae bacterium]|nr:hypothetical protein [Oscillospiraceae bacterium]
MKILRNLSLLALAVLFVFSMAACGEDTAQVEITVTVEAHDYEGSPIVLGDVTFEHENPTVLVALEQMCIAREAVLEYDSLGIVQKIGDVSVKAYTDKETGKDMKLVWGWKLNGEEIKGFANETVIKTGDKIEYFQYPIENEEQEIVDPFGEITGE